MSFNIPHLVSGLSVLSRFGTLCFPGLRKIRGEAPFFKQVRSGAAASPPCNGEPWTGLVALEWFRALFEQVRSGAVASPPCNGEPGMAQVCGGKRAADDAASSHGAGSAVG